MPGIFVQGIDVSHHQGKIDFKKVAADGIRFVLMKASEGVTFRDPRFQSNWKNAGAAGIKKGAYHFFRPGPPGKDQADNLTNQLKIAGFKKGDIVPAADCEDYDGSGTKKYQANLQEFLDRIEEAWDIKCLIYTYRAFWKKIGDPTQFGGYPLWVVDLSSVSKPKLPVGWTDYAIWQYSFTGSVSGIAGDVDLDRFKGAPADLSAISY